MAVPDRVSMANSAEQLIYQAAVLLEEHRDSEGALSALAEAINVAGLSHRTLELIRAKTFRGELLMQLDRNAEAVPDFRDVVALAELFEGDRELVAEEAEACRAWLERLDH